MIRIEQRLQPERRWQIGSPLLALLLSLLSSAGVLHLLGVDVAATLIGFFYTPISEAYGWAELCLKATPLVLCALGLSVCFRAGVWNIGAEGQFIIGALLGGAVALSTDGWPSTLAVSATLLAGTISGTLWAWLPAVLKTRFGASEILTTIMLNYIAMTLLAYAVHGPLKDPDGFNFPESALFSDQVLLPTLFADYRLTIAALFAVALTAVATFMHHNSVLFLKIRVLGSNTSAAKFLGLRQKPLVWLVLCLSGATAGLAGITEVTGPVGQLTTHISFGYGYAAIIAAYLGRLHPIGILLASLLLSLTYLGGEQLQLLAGLPKSMANLFQGMLLLYLLSVDFFVNYKIIYVNKLSSPNKVIPT